MQTIQISNEVWQAIKAYGQFGETEADQVLRRVFKIPANKQNQQKTAAVDVGGPCKDYVWKQRRTTDRMTQTVNGNKLILEFDSGSKFERELPAKNDHSAIRKVRDAAVEFVRSKNGTKGQEHAAIRALTSRGYHITVKREYE
jgi:negative regulator of replication initiation